MRSFWHFREIVAHGCKCILQGRLFHLSCFITRHNSTCTAYSSPAMNIGISVLLHQILHLVNELMHSLYRLWHIHIADWEAKIGGVAGQQLAIWPQLTLFGEVNKMAHAKVVHSLQLCFCQFPVFVPGIFPSEQFPTNII